MRPGTTLGRYEIRRLLGQGGMGCVYEAIHRDLKKRVAIKTLLPSLASSSDAKQRFLREGEAASRIRHPHVVDVTDVGAEGPVIYLVMEYLEGEDLARTIARQGFLSATQAADIMLPVAAAIATAHEQGVIHRDLKPENIFMAQSGYGAPSPKVLDFGISKVLGDSRARSLTGTAATMGTMNYLPPEQLRAAREADARSDQYGLGTILYECVTGQRAFDEESFYIVLKKIAEGEFARPSSRRDVPPRMEAIILRAMSLEPLNRFESVKQFGAALLELASDGARGIWAPFFGAAPAIDELAPAPRITNDRARVATMIAPSSASSSSAGATLALPAPRKSASTTMRNATGERDLRMTLSSRRSRAPWVVGGVALVAAVAVLVILRGTGAQSQRGEAGRGDVETAAPTSAASLPSRSNQDNADNARQPPARALPPKTLAVPAQDPVPAPTRVQDRLPGRIVDPNRAAPGATDDSANDAQTTPRLKPGARAAAKASHRTARVRHVTTDSNAEAPETGGSLPNNAPIIP